MKRNRPKAERLTYFKMRFPDDALVEYVVWKLPKSTPDRLHGYKYRYFYGKDGVRFFIADVQAHRAKEVSDDQ